VERMTPHASTNVLRATSAATVLYSENLKHDLKNDPGIMRIAYNAPVGLQFDTGQEIRPLALPR
jgi:hypothetical protein